MNVWASTWLKSTAGEYDFFITTWDEDEVDGDFLEEPHIRITGRDFPNEDAAKKELKRIIKKMGWELVRLDTSGEGEFLKKLMSGIKQATGRG